MIDKYIHRHYTKELENSDKTVYDLFNWKEVDVVLKDYLTGKVLTDMKKLQFPEHYSQSACDIIASKYFRKRGIKEALGYEYSMKQVAHRMVLFWVNSMKDSKLINEEQSKIVYDELVFTMLSQMWAPNSPQWFNTGISLYGITSEAAGHYYFDEEKGETVKSTDGYTRTQGSACFITSIEDSLMGPKSLTSQLSTETLLFKYGSGVGSNWSSIRAKNESLSGGGKSSGLLSFLKVSDRNAGAIKSGGTTRRAAKMNVLNLDHPEILEYIKWKAEEEDKAYALGKMGYNLGMDGDAYETVSGQNANNSVRITNEYMKKLGTGAKWQTKGRVDKSVGKELDVDVIWNKIAEAAWRCGDPGVQYDDIINDWHTCPAGEDGVYNAPYNRINASNPCSEYMFLDDTACNLSSINLMRFYDVNSGKFDFEGYKHNIFLNQLVLEATIHIGQFPTEDIARKSYLFRTTGLGFTNLGTLILSMGLSYDSEEARNLGASLASLLTGYSYFTSSLMAQKLGAFSKYEVNKEYMMRVIKNHASTANYENKEFSLNYNPVKINFEYLSKLGFSKMKENLKDAWENAIKSGEKYGFRNAQVSVLAPTGTIAFAMDCETTSSEPFFSHIAFKKLVGGGFMEIINKSIGIALRKLGYTESQIIEIEHYIMRKKDGIIEDGKIEGAPHLKWEHYSVFDTANKCGTGERFIAPTGHVKMMAAISPHITGAISKTVNLPKTATVEDIKEIYKLSWQLGIKAIALYRDGCKASQPLNTVTYAEESNLENLSYNALLEYTKNATKKSEAEVKTSRKKLEGIRAARVHAVDINGLKLYITASKLENGELGEIFISSGKQGDLVKGLLDSLSRTISVMLQYGIPAKDIAKMYRGHKYEPSGMVKGHPNIKSIDSISDLISKIIEIEMEDYSNVQIKPTQWENENKIEQLTLDISNLDAADTIYGEVCSTCNSTKLVKAGICKVCMECGTTTGCS